MQINKVYNESCLDTMSRMEDDFVDLTVTSPPYDNLRSYKNGIGDSWGDHVWKPVIQELYRVTKKGGVVVWVVGDVTIQGSETGTSFKQALWAMECGFRLHDTMIYKKNNPVPNEVGYRQQACFEYMFILSKGKPKTFNPILVDAKMYGKVKPKKDGKQFRQKDGGMKASHGLKYNKPKKFKHNIWEYHLSGRKKHPAVFPDALAEDHILVWSKAGDIVYDPFAGSGTTAKMSILNNRNWVASELAKEYCDIISERVIK